MVISVPEYGLPVKLLGKGLIFGTDRDLNEYFVTDHTLVESGDVNQNQQLKIRLTLKRRIMNSVMTTYMPTLLLCIICHCTVYYKDTLFKAVVTVNLMSLLCLITMFLR